MIRTAPHHGRAHSFVGRSLRHAPRTPPRATSRPAPRPGGAPNANRSSRRDANRSRSSPSASASNAPRRRRARRRSRTPIALTRSPIARAVSRVVVFRAYRLGRRRDPDATRRAGSRHAPSAMGDDRSARPCRRTPGTTPGAPPPRRDDRGGGRYDDDRGDYARRRSPPRRAPSPDESAFEFGVIVTLRDSFGFVRCYSRQGPQLFFHASEVMARGAFEISARGRGRVRRPRRRARVQPSRPRRET